MKRLDLVFAICLALIALQSCKKETIIEAPGAAAGGVGNIYVNNYGTTAADFTLNFFVVDAFGKDYNGSLNSSNVTIQNFTSTSGLSFSFSNIKITELPANNLPSYDACMLMDQSGSIKNTDPYDLRIDAAKTFCNNLGINDRVYLGSFASGSSYFPQDLMWYGSAGFTHNGAMYNDVLNALAGKEEGGTPLYKSIYDAMTKTKNLSSNSNKAVLAFTDGDDTEGGKTVQQIINYYQTTGVKVFTIGLSNQIQNTSNLCNIANKCGGYFIYAGNAKQLISTFGYLGRVLNRTARRYKLTSHLNVNFTLNAYTAFSNYVRVTLADGNTLYLPFTVNFN